MGGGPVQRRRMFMVVVIVILACAGRAILFGQEPATAPTAAALYGFRDTVHTALTVSRNLNSPPQAQQPHRLWVMDPSGWREFSQTGGVIEDGKVDATGSLLHTERYQYDPQGNQIGKTVTEGGKTTTYGWEVRTSQRESTEFTETVEYVDGKPGRAWRSAYNPESGEYLQLDDKGEVLLRSITLQKEGKFESQNWNGRGESLSHHVELFDHQGNTVQVLRYNAQGEVISSLSFKDNVLISWWHAPECVAASAILHPDDRTTVFYSSSCLYNPLSGGPISTGLVKDVRHYLNQNQFDLAGEELYSESGVLLERIAYAYEFDEHRNWTRCAVSVMDWETRMMVPVKEFIRKLTYYPSQL